MPVMEELTVLLKASAGPLVAGLKKAQQASTAAVNTFDKLTTKVSGVGKKFDSAGKAALGMGASFTSLSLGISKVISLTNVQEIAERKLAAAIKGTGKAIDIDKIKSYAAELQKVTTFGDEATIAASALLTTFGLTEKQLLDLLPAVQNVAVQFNQDLNQSALMVGRALTHGVGALSRVGISLSDAEKEAFKFANQNERVNLLLQILHKNTGPAARELAKLGSGQLKQLSNALGDLGEVIGKVFLDTLAPAASIGVSVIQKLTAAFDAMSPVTKRVAGILTLVSTGIMGAGGLAAGVVFLIPKVAGLVKTFGLLQLTLLKVAAIVAPLIAGIGGISMFAERLAVSPFDTAAQEALQRKQRKEFGITGEEGFFEAFGKTAKGFFTKGLTTVTDPIVSAFDVQFEDVGKGLTSSIDKVFDGINADAAKTLRDAGNKLKKKVTDVLDDWGEEFALPMAFGTAGLTRELSTREIEGIEIAAAQARAAFEQQIAREQLRAEHIARLEAKEQERMSQISDASLDLVGSMGKAGPAARQAIEGDLQGAVLAFGAAVIQETESFAQISEMSDKLVESLAPVADLALKSLYPLTVQLELLAEAVKRIGKIVTSVTDGITGFLKPIGSAIKSFFGVSDASDYATTSLTALGGSLNEMGGTIRQNQNILTEDTRTLVERLLEPFEYSDIAWQAERLGFALENLTDRQLEEFLSGLTKMAEELEDQIAILSIRNDVLEDDPLRQDLNSINAAIETISSELEGSAGILEEGSEALTDTVDKMNAQLTNVPSGFKVALNKFRAIQGEAMTSTFGGTRALTGVQAAVPERLEGGDKITIENVNVESTGNLDELVNEIKARSKWGGAVMGGPKGGRFPVFKGNPTP